MIHYFNIRFNFSYLTFLLEAFFPPSTILYLKMYFV